MTKKANLAGIKFGRLVVIGDAPTVHGRVHWLCRCACGEERAVAANNLTAGRQVSCGCYGKEVKARGTRKTHGLRHTPEYGAWAAMRRRCQDPKNKRFANYGGRGVAVCARWDADFAAFYADMGPRPPGMTLDRIDNNGPYSPDNCRWATPRQQQQNKSNNRILTAQGRKACIVEWSRIANVARTTIWSRINRGWDLDRAISTPPDPIAGRFKASGRKQA